MREYLMSEWLILIEVEFSLFTDVPAQAAEIGGLRLVRMSQIIAEPIGWRLICALFSLRQRGL